MKTHQSQGGPVGSLRGRILMLGMACAAVSASLVSGDIASDHSRMTGRTLTSHRTLMTIEELAAFRLDADRQDSSLLGFDLGLDLNKSSNAPFAHLYKGTTPNTKTLGNISMTGGHVFLASIGQAIGVEDGIVTSESSDSALSVTTGSYRFDGTGKLSVGSKGLGGPASDPKNITVSSGSEIMAPGRDLVVTNGCSVNLDGGSVSVRTITLESDAKFQLTETAGSHLQVGSLVLDRSLTNLLGNTPLVAGTSIEADDLTIQNGTLDLAGGSLRAGNLKIQNAGSIRFTSGQLEVESRGASTALRVGANDGLVGDAANPNLVNIPAGSSINVGNYSDSKMTVASGAILRLDGGDLAVGDIVREAPSPSGSAGKFEWTSGSLTVFNDLHISDDGLLGKQIELTSGQKLDIVGKTYNEGTLVIQPGASFKTDEMIGSGNVVNNGGTFEVRKRVLHAMTPPTADIVGEEITVDGDLRLNKGVRAVGKVVVPSNSSVRGTGTICGELVNRGTLRPGNSPGSLTVEGNFSQIDTGVYEAEIGKNGNATANDMVVVKASTSGTGMANVGGTLRLLTLGGYKAKVGESFMVLQAQGGISGVFNLDAGGATLATPDRAHWQLVYDNAGGRVYAQVSGDPQEKVQPSYVAQNLPAPGNHELPRTPYITSSASRPNSIPDINPTPVPEPAVMSIVVGGVMVLLGRRRRQD